MKNAAQVVALMLEDDPVVQHCAWCQKERGEIPDSKQSHGICSRHRQEMMAQLADLHKEMGTKNPPPPEAEA